MKSSNLDRAKAGLKQDIVTTRVLFDPLALPLVALCLRFPRLQPNHLTATALLLGLAAAIGFGGGYARLGAVLYYAFFLFDRMDGTLARAAKCFHPLGKLYDFVADRNVVWLMSMGLAFSAWQEEALIRAWLYLVYVSLFLLKDVWAHEMSDAGPLQAASPQPSGGSKTHFKPGQVLSCHLAFLFAPLTGMYRWIMPAAILCVLFSLGVHGLVPLIRLYRRHGLVERSIPAETPD